MSCVMTTASVSVFGHFGHSTQPHASINFALGVYQCSLLPLIFAMVTYYGQLLCREHDSGKWPVNPTLLNSVPDFTPIDKNML